jgi:hypothetical protein
LARYIGVAFVRGLARTEDKATIPNDAKVNGPVPFPLTVRGILAMCWALTMNLSHEERQVELGKTFTDKFLQIFAEDEKAEINKPFLQNVLMELSSTLRSIGFIRANHVQYLDYEADRLTRKRKNLEQVADMASFSGSGLYAKVGSFIGFGSVANLVKGLGFPEGDILWFAVAGIAGAVGVTLGVKYYVSITDASWENEITTRQNEYWRKEFKPDVTAQLLSLFSQVKALIWEYYPNANEIIQHDELLRMSNDNDVKRVISNQILPPDGLRWPPYIMPDAQKSTGGHAVKPQREEKGEKKGAEVAQDDANEPS